MTNPAEPFATPQAKRRTVRKAGRAMLLVGMLVGVLPMFGPAQIAEACFVADSNGELVWAPSNPLCADSGTLGRVAGGKSLRVNVAEAAGGLTVIGQLTMAQANSQGFFTAYACNDGIPRNTDGNISKSDLNFGASDPSASNRLIVPADTNGDICIYTSVDAHIIVDVFGTTDDIDTFTNQRTDTRLFCPSNAPGETCTSNTVDPNAETLSSGSTLRVPVASAVGGQTVIGQLTMAQATGRGFFTAYACNDGIPRDTDGNINKSDLNFGTDDRSASNRLIVPADNNGDICIYTSIDTHIIVDVFGVTDDIDTFANERTDTRFSVCALSDATTGVCVDRVVLPGGVRSEQPLRAGFEERITINQIDGNQTVIGQLTAAGANTRGFLTAYAGACGEVPRNSAGQISKSDLNYGPSTPSSNRLIVPADRGAICIYTSAETDIVVDIFGVTDDIDTFPNQRTDTRDGRPEEGNVVFDSNWIALCISPDFQNGGCIEYVVARVVNGAESEIACVNEACRTVRILTDPATRCWTATADGVRPDGSVALTETNCP